jgi:type I restriction enzyme S subunit
MRVEKTKLGSIVTLKRGYDLPSYRREEGAIPIVSSSGITGHHNAAMVRGPGVVTGRYGTLGEVFYLEEDFWPLNTSLYVQDFHGNNPQFIYYFLQQVLSNTASDKAAVPGVNRNDLHARDVVCPDPDSQESIADFLTNYDDLIENNRRRIELLEESARLLYREWFVHLRFPGHEHIPVEAGVPEGWVKQPLGDITKLNYGKALTGDNRVAGPYPVYGSSGIVGWHEKPLVAGPGILVGRKGNVGRIFWSNMDFYPIDTLYFIDNEESNYYLYFALQHTKFINTDVAVPGLNRDLAHSQKILVPDKQIVSLFEEYITTTFKQIHALQPYNDNLAKARDILLPRLMNGELAV